MDLKPKRVLTEAQRLAFLKGREKRMANIEKNRLAKLEFQEATKEETVVEPEPEPVAPKMEEKKPDPEPTEAQPPVPTAAPEIIPPMPKLKRQKVSPLPEIDEDKFASLVADKIVQQMMPPSTTRKPRKPRTVKILDDVAESKNEENGDEEKPHIYHNVPPFVANFSWL